MFNPITRAFAYNAGPQIDGTVQVGDIAAGDQVLDYDNGLDWWNGPDETLGYVICYPQSIGSRTGGSGVIPVSAPTIGFWRTPDLTDQSFVETCNLLFSQSFLDPVEAKTWLTSNGYWTSYVAPVLYLDAGNPASYPGSGSTWTDLIGLKTFNLYNGVTYDSANDGKLVFDSDNAQYAECSQGLPVLPKWTIGVWHYYTGQNSGSGMCLVTEVYPGSTYQINYSLGDNYDNGNLSAGFFDGAWRTSGGYALAPNDWYYIVGTFDGSTISLYINNTLVSTSNYGGSPNSSYGGIRLMRRWDNPDYWAGHLSTVAIYDSALSAAQINSIWNLTKSRYGL